MAPKLLITGPPGGGKGTLCDHLVERYGLVHVSGGDILRDHVKRGTKLGKEVDSIMKAGKLVPDSIMVKLILHRISQPDAVAKGVLLDGFPRTLPQAVALTKAGLKFDALVCMDVPDATLIERSAGRRLDPQTNVIYHLKHKPPPADIVHRLVIRGDDQPEKQLERMKIYAQQRDPVLKHFAKITVRINGDQKIDAVYQNFLNAMEDRKIGMKPAKPSSKL